MGQSKVESKLFMKIYAHEFTKSDKNIIDFWDNQFKEKNKKQNKMKGSGIFKHTNKNEI